jgi:hypothetical protein
MCDLPEALALACDLPSLITLRRTCSSFYKRLDDINTLLLLSELLFNGIHTDTDEYIIHVQPLHLTFATSGTFSLLVDSVSRYYLSPLSHLLLDPHTFDIRLASYGLLQQTPKTQGTVVSCMEAGARYGHERLVMKLLKLLSLDCRHTWLQSVSKVFLIACKYNQVTVVSSMLLVDAYDINDGRKYIITTVENDSLEVLQTILSVPSQMDKELILTTAGRCHSTRIIDYYIDDPLLVFQGAVNGDHVDLLEKYKDQAFQLADVDNHMVNAVMCGAVGSMRWLYNNGATDKERYVDIVSRQGTKWIMVVLVELYPGVLDKCGVSAVTNCIECLQGCANAVVTIGGYFFRRSREEELELLTYLLQSGIPVPKEFNLHDGSLRADVLAVLSSHGEG